MVSQVNRKRQLDTTKRGSSNLKKKAKNSNFEGYNFEGMTKAQIRREKNKISAARSRERQANLMASLKSQVETLTSTNSDLMNIINELKAENFKLSNRLTKVEQKNQSPLPRIEDKENSQHLPVKIEKDFFHNIDDNSSNLESNNVPFVDLVDIESLDNSGSAGLGFVSPFEPVELKNI